MFVLVDSFEIYQARSVLVEWAVGVGATFPNFQASLIRAKAKRYVLGQLAATIVWTPYLVSQECPTRLIDI